MRSLPNSSTSSFASGLFNGSFSDDPCGEDGAMEDPKKKKKRKVAKSGDLRVITSPSAGPTSLQGDGMEDEKGGRGEGKEGIGDHEKTGGAGDDKGEHEKVEADAMSGEVLASKVARAVLDKYAQLPRNGKPGPQEWTILAGIVVSRGREGNVQGHDLAVVSLATGSKCLGPSKMKEGGRLLNDSHGEVLARRGLVSLLLGELGVLFGKANVKGDDRQEKHEDTGARRGVGIPGVESDEDNKVKDKDKDMDMDGFLLELVEGQDPPKARLKPNLSLHMYVSQAPCGDASIFTLGGGADACEQQHCAAEALKGAGAGAGEGAGDVEGDGDWDRMQGAGRGDAVPPAPKRFKVSTDDRKLVELKDDTVRTGAKLANMGEGVAEEDGARQAIGATRIKPGRGERTR
jgi:hypothetical protein